MNTIFIDVKYTDLDENNRQPISIALIEMNHGDRAYLEFSDYDLNLCSQNIKENVLPLLRSSSGLSISEGMTFLTEWILKKGDSIIVGESMNEYYTILQHLQNTYTLQHFVWLPHLIKSSLNLQSEDSLSFFIDRFNSFKELYFSTNNASTYNALEDAEATFYAFNKIQKFHIQPTI